MASKMSWDEIRNVFIDEWVLLADYEISEDSLTVLSGMVLEHTRSKNTLLTNLQRYKGMDLALRFTGEIGKGYYLF